MRSIIVLFGVIAVMAQLSMLYLWTRSDTQWVLYGMFSWQAIGIAIILEAARRIYVTVSPKS